MVNRAKPVKMGEWMEIVVGPDIWNYWRILTLNLFHIIGNYLENNEYQFQALQRSSRHDDV